ncbi:unnamed protein product, partial [Amoebophrya sp. A25]|eukprot:GSA25T00001341001.1
MRSTDSLEDPTVLVGPTMFRKMGGYEIFASYREFLDEMRLVVAYTWNRPEFKPYLHTRYWATRDQIYYWDAAKIPVAPVGIGGAAGEGGKAN